MKRYFLFSLILFFSLSAFSQHEPQKYVPETDSLVLQKLEQWQNMKFGLLMHWGAYSQWGIVESWSICPEDYGWCERKKGSSPENYFEYVKEYENLKTTFNPVNFDPEKWAKAAKNAGMKYVVFTTKHHDGFSMFDTQLTDYKVTDSACPFYSNPKSNITKEVFNAFRDQGLWTGAYFSKPDWHNDNYWDPYFPPKDRNVNYDPEEYPEKWEKYVQFTQGQIMELMSDYGKVDILWLDGGWVAKQSKEDMEEFYAERAEKSKSGFIKNGIVNQNIRMDELVEKARKKQPGLIVVDRAVEGKNQNYLTPENQIPKEALPYPWESCIIAGGGWSWVPNAKYMSGYKAINILVDIVAKGGNLLLNIAPGPDGSWDEGAYKLLDEVGNWMDINSEAIYGTNAISPYKESNICFTQNGSSIYAIYVMDENQNKIPSEIKISSFKSSKKTKIQLLGTGKKLKWKQTKDGIIINIPDKYQNNLPSKYAVVFKISSVKM
ncbi:MAG: alpha-L-fucosidase [Marinilabiliales bacterium]|nr:MAG: alpha-L-fucosidase [Marinilabiliales bacterium]